MRGCAASDQHNAADSKQCYVCVHILSTRCGRQSGSTAAALRCGHFKVRAATVNVQRHKHVLAEALNVQRHKHVLDEAFNLCCSSYLCGVALRCVITSRSGQLQTAVWATCMDMLHFSNQACIVGKRAYGSNSTHSTPFYFLLMFPQVHVSREVVPRASCMLHSRPLLEGFQQQHRQQQYLLIQLQRQQQQQCGCSLHPSC